MAKSVAILIPVFNEEATLSSVLDRAAQVPGVDQIVVADDGSSDRTPHILKERLEKGDKRLRIISHSPNRGKGAAIRAGLSVADADCLVIRDADEEYDFSDLALVVDRLKKSDAEVVFGSRFLQKNPNRYWLYLLGNKTLTAVINILGGGHLTDSYTAYKGMDLWRWRKMNLQSDGFEIEAEISMKALIMGWKMEEIPIRYSPRAFEAGKKIRGKDALIGALTALFCWLKHRVFRRPV